MGNQHPHFVEDKPAVLIVGGGFAGCSIAKTLDRTKKFNVVLIERKNYFLHNLGLGRAVVSEGWGRHIAIKYDKMLSNGSVVNADVVEISPTYVKVLGQDKTFGFDYLVIATGSRYPFPFKCNLPESDLFHFRTNELRKKIVEAHNIVIVGGGPCGCELAGEIVSEFNYSFGEDFESKYKVVTVVHSNDQLCNNILGSKFFTEKIKMYLIKLNIKVVLGDKVIIDPETQKKMDVDQVGYIAGKQTLKTEKGKEIQSDLTFFCTGPKVNNKALKANAMMTDKLDETGRLKVNGYLQVEGTENVFAAGDCASGSPMTAFHAGKQADIVANNIQALCGTLPAASPREHKKDKSQKKHLKKYTKPAKQGIFLSLGKTGGVSQFTSGMVWGNTVTRNIKSKSLFVSQSWELLGRKGDPKTASFAGATSSGTGASSSVVTRNLAAAMQLTEEEARAIKEGSLPIERPGS